jgi:chemotaxis protein methyltransferase CheR
MAVSLSGPLAQPPSDRFGRTMIVDPELESLEIELLLSALARRYGYDFRGYAPASLRRRIRWAVEHERLSTVSELLATILHDTAALRRFIARLSVHVTGMFRDPAFYRALQKDVFPTLRTYTFTRIWHAGCSSGEEVYSLAILLKEAGLYDRCRIYATDLSEDLLARAKSGVVPLSGMREHTKRYLEAGGSEDFSQYYATDADSAVFQRELRKNVVFSQHNLVSDGPFNSFHLILCRNVLIYFSRELRNRVHELLYESLVRRGALALGMRESIRFTPRASEYETVNEGMRIYRRIR